MPACEHCGKTFDKQGKLNLHKYHCEIKKLKNSAADPEHQKCDHDFRLLNPKNANEYNAMTNGYTEVCVKCQELQ